MQQQRFFKFKERRTRHVRFVFDKGYSLRHRHHPSHAYIIQRAIQKTIQNTRAAAAASKRKTKIAHHEQHVTQESQRNKQTERKKKKTRTMLSCSSVIST